jgi:hypothetical protein
MNFNEFIHACTEGKLSSRPDFYSGRGANLGDLNSEIIDLIYQGFITHFNQQKADEYVKFVANIKCASATSFLINLRIFYETGSTNVVEQNTDVSRDNYELSAFYTLFSLMNNGPDQSFQILSPFLKTHLSDDEYVKFCINCNGVARFDEFGRYYIY